MRVCVCVCVRERLNCCHFSVSGQNTRTIIIVHGFCIHNSPLVLEGAIIYRDDIIMTSPTIVIQQIYDCL